MVSHKSIIVFHGHGSEYPFNRLAAVMKARGHQVVEADMSLAGWRQRVLSETVGSQIILVSAHHPQATGSDYNSYYGLKDDILNLAQVQALLAPIATYFIPHDLSQPLHAFEAPEMRRVSAAFMPDTSYWYLKRFCRVDVLGWIGNITDPNCGEQNRGLKPKDVNQILFFPSDIASHIRHGVDGFLEDYAGVLERQPRTKMPRGSGFDAIETALQASGCYMVDSENRIFDLVSSNDIVVCSGSSSVVLEAASLGARIIAVQDRFAYGDEMSRAFGHLATVSIVTPDALAAYISGLQSQAHTISELDTKPFQIDLFEEFCLSAY
jgi:hypothetical protein